MSGLLTQTSTQPARLQGLDDFGSWNRNREARSQREAFRQVRKAEVWYSAQLRKIARHIGDLVKAAYNPSDPGSVPKLTDMLERYAEILQPWSQAVGARMLMDVEQRDERAWRRYSQYLGIEIRELLQRAPVGAEYASLMEDQVRLITSLPLEAARRVHEIATRQLYSGERWESLAHEIMRTGEVTQSRANLIARTETTRAATTFTMARARHVGSEGYVWRTAKDEDVRLSHKRMEGRFVRWNDPPEVEPGKRYHCGETFNCRCFCEPVLSDEF